MSKLLKEPLLHFLVLGAVLFGLYSWLGRGSGRGAGPAEEIVVSQGRIRSFAEGFGRVWNRLPTGQELTGLVRDYVREEALYREALALGLDRDDTIVRRRLAQKIEFLSDDLAAAVEPTDRQLAEYLERHPDSFRTESRFTFSQIFLDPQRRGARLASDAAQMLARLNAGSASPDPAALGDSRMLEPHFDDAARRDVAAQFGEVFVTALTDLALRRWEGPVKSGYGVHLVRVEKRALGRVPELAEVRDDVAREWSAEKRREVKEDQFQALLQRYKVTIEQSTANGEAPSGATEAAGGVAGTAAGPAEPAEGKR